MKPIAVFCLTAAVAAATAFAVTVLKPQFEMQRPTMSLAPDEIGRLARSIDALERRTNEMQKSLDDLRASGSMSTPADSRIPLGEIEAAVKRNLDSRGVSAPPEAAESTPAKKPDAKELVAKLSGGTLSYEEEQALWAEIGKAGMIDEVLAMFEQAAKDRPNDTIAHTDLGKAYIEKLQSVGSGEAGKWATKADKEFNSALTLDDHNWEARFNKAIALSFWPPILGKQSEAIENFEILVKQQQGQPGNEGYALTHLWLGNLYQQSGKTDKAIAAWQQGLALYPNHDQLKQQLASAQAH
jgi:tetratricopeptide (TPR) repeat protein